MKYSPHFNCNLTSRQHFNHWEMRIWSVIDMDFLQDKAKRERQNPPQQGCWRVEGEANIVHKVNLSEKLYSFSES